MASEFLTIKHTNSEQDLSQQDRLMSLMTMSPYVWRKSGKDAKIIWDNKALAAAIFCTEVDNIPMSPVALAKRLCGDGAAKRTQAYASLTWNGAKFQIDYQIQTFDGRTLWIEERAERVEGEGNKPTKVVGALTNIQTRKTKQEQAGYHAVYDKLTGLWNRDRMGDALIQMLALSRKYNRNAAYICCRISNLDQINMSYGFEAGDRLLGAVARRLKACVIMPDICARVSGASFGIGLTDCDPQDLKAAAGRIADVLSSRPFGSPYGDLYAEFSVGATAFSQDNHSAFDTMTHADLAARHSDDTGDNITVYTSDLLDLSPRQNRVEFTRDSIITALNERNITLAYQPIIHAKGRKTHHYESLLRLRRDDGELVSAGEFIMAAEDLGCVHLLDRRALEIAAQTLQDHSTIILAINVSAATVQNPDTARAYLQALRGLGRATERVIVEMTETVALDSPEMASQFSSEVRQLGCQFAIDDFGAGHTTFSNLMAIEADEIKIDGSFIQGLSLTPHKQVFVRMMVDLAQTFSVKTVAEMVESREDADLLMRLGVDYLQGYMFGLPGAIPHESDK
ncbi:MAG: EAL domain-containing protein [Robiginitomaculum sp.]|nr:EAL domain-containing protein [Robiginitomaculum sp.]